MTCGHISVTRYPLRASDYASTYSATAHTWIVSLKPLTMTYNSLLLTVFMYFYTPEAILLPGMMVLKNATPFGMTHRLLF